MSDYRLHYRGDVTASEPQHTLVDAYGYPLRVDRIDYDQTSDISTVHLSIDTPEPRGGAS